MEDDWKALVPGWAARHGAVDADDLSRWLEVFSTLSHAGVDLQEVVDFLAVLYGRDLLGGAAEQRKLFLQFVQRGLPANLVLSYRPGQKRPRERWHFKAILGVELDVSTVSLGRELATTWQGTSIPPVRGAA